MPRIAGIALLAVQVGVDPRAVLVVDSLSNAVRLLPIALGIVPERSEGGRTSIRRAGILEAGTEVCECHQPARRNGIPIMIACPRPWRSGPWRNIVTSASACSGA